MDELKNRKNEDQSTVYKLSKQYISVIIFFAISSLFLGFLINFSLAEKISSILESNITKNRACPMRADAIGVALMFPKVAINDLEVSGTCLKGPSPLLLKNVNSKLALPSFSPFGASLESEVIDKYSKINILSVHNISSHYFKIESKKVNALSIQSFLPNFKLAGSFELNSNITVLKDIITDLTLHLKSNNFSVPAQNMDGFEIPNLKIGPLSLKTEMKSKDKLDILELIVGNELSPIRANISGIIDLNQFNIAQSNIEMFITVKFSQPFLDSFSILNLFLDPNKQDAQGFYKIKLTGPIEKLNKPEFLN